MGEFIKSKSKIIIKTLIIIAAFVAISFLSALIMMAFGIIYFEDGIKLNVELFNSFKNSWYGWVIIILIQVVITTLLSFIPGTSMAFIILIQTLYDRGLFQFKQRSWIFCFFSVDMLDPQSVNIQTCLNPD